jgi:hypothetical protein
MLINEAIDQQLFQRASEASAAASHPFRGVGHPRSDIVGFAYCRLPRSPDLRPTQFAIRQQRSIRHRRSLRNPLALWAAASSWQGFSYLFKISGPHGAG